MSPTALVVDDQTQMVSIVAFALETQGFTCLTAHSAEQAWAVLTRRRVDIVILDIMLPGASGIALCERIRATSGTPVILLTAKDSTDDRIAGLLAGADDYLTKPFSPRELALRAQAVHRRAQGGPGDGLLVNGPLVIDTVRRRATWDGRVLHVSDVELRLLTALARHKGEVVTWSTLLNEVWFTESGSGGREMIKTTVYRLRQRLDTEGRPLIVTVRGMGYLMPDQDPR